MSTKTLRLIVLSVLLSGQSVILGQLPNSPALMSRVVPKTHLEAHSMEDLLAQLALKYSIPIAFETRSDDDSSEYGLDFNGGTLKDLFTQLVARNRDYSWKIDDDVVSIFPTDSSSHALLRDLLNTQISHFSIEPGTSCWNLKNSLFATPELQQALKYRGLQYDAGSPGGFYIPQVGNDFSLEVSDASARAILNRIIKGSSVAKMWSLKTDGSGTTVLMSLKANLERPTIRSQMNEHQ